MNNIGCWNTWGLNSTQKQNAVRQWINNNQLEIVGLLESKVNGKNLEKVQTKLTTQRWDFISNTNTCNPPQCRILIGWNPSKNSLAILHSSPQWMTCAATSTSDNTTINITFVYDQNTPAERRVLWDYISANSASFSYEPWLLMGDFNAILSPQYRDGGDSNWYGHSEDFASTIRQSIVI